MLHTADYQLIASAISKADTLYDVVLELCWALKQDNEKFNAERFVDGCGIKYLEGLPK